MANQSHPAIMDDRELAIRCAFMDLINSLNAYRRGDIAQHEWGAHEQTIEDLAHAFPEYDLSTQRVVTELPQAAQGQTHTTHSGLH
jgi:hypothetical protein